MSHESGKFIRELRHDDGSFRSAEECTPDEIRATATEMWGR